MAKNIKRFDSIDKEKTRFKKRTQSQEESRSTMFKVEKQGSSKNGKLTGVNCGKKHYGECLMGTRSFYGCVKEKYKGERLSYDCF